jgi:hypothetical protein
VALSSRNTMWSRRLDYTRVSVWLGRVAVLGLDKDAGDFGERSDEARRVTGSTVTVRHYRPRGFSIAPASA